jgi:hypothetical protein
MENNNEVIFSEYYFHEGCDCYKILMPFTKFRESKMVLCPVSEGLDKAKEIARRVLNERIEKALKDNKYASKS